MRRRRLATGAVLSLCAMGVFGLLLADTLGRGRSDVQPVVRGEMPVTSADVRLGGTANNSPAVVGHPNDEDFVALASRVDALDFSCRLHLSFDGGRVWVPAAPVPRLPEGAEKCYAPEVAFDRDGTLRFLFVGLRGKGNTPMGVFLANSSDRGRTFSIPRLVLGPNKFQVRMVLDRGIGEVGRIHLVWLDATSQPTLGGFGPPPNPIMSAFSDDGGATFSTPIQVSDPGRPRVVAPAVAVGADHRVHVAYYDLGDDALDYQGLEGGETWEGTWSLMTTVSEDGGRRFRPSTVVDDAIVPASRVMLVFTMPAPALAADTARPSVYVAWPDGRHGDSDVLSRRSLDGGRTWGESLRLNDDDVGNGREQLLPQLAVAPGGRVDAMFYDRRVDPENVRNDISYTFSTNGGAAFGPNVTLTSENSDSRIGQRYSAIPSARGLVEFGSRLGLLSRRSSAVTAWADTRNVLGKGDAEGGPIAQDIFSARVDFVPATSGNEKTGKGSPATVLEVTMDDYRFEHSATVPAGRVIVEARNEGHVDHQLVMVALPDDFLTSIGDQLASSTRRAFPTLAHLPPRPPGKRGVFAVDVPPGRFAFICFVKDADGVQHADRGMSSDLRVN